MTRCPHCFNFLSPERYAFQCDSGRCDAVPDEQGSLFHGAPTTWRPTVIANAPRGVPGWRPPANVQCQRCGGPTRECCPICHYILPGQWREGTATCFALAGARATGKSIYIGVVIKQLELLAQTMGTTLSFVNSASRETYHTVYERPLYETRGIIPPTPRANLADSYQRDPIILSLGVVGGQRRFLVFRDVAGEDLEGQVEQHHHLRFFANASAVLFMFDPTRVSEVRDQLQDLIPAQLHEGGDPAVVLNNLNLLIGAGRPRLAVVLSKFDTMQALRKVEGTGLSRIMSNMGAAFMRDPGAQQTSFDLEDAALLHAEVRSLLQRLGATNLVTAVERPNSGRTLDHRFFTVSALGAPTDGEQLHDRGIASFRCLDPIRWALHRDGVL